MYQLCHPIPTSTSTKCLRLHTKMEREYFQKKEASRSDLLGESLSYKETSFIQN